LRGSVSAHRHETLGNMVVSPDNVGSHGRGANQSSNRRTAAAAGEISAEADKDGGEL